MNIKEKTEIQTLDDLFGIPIKGIEIVDIDKLRPFKNHPFQVTDNDELRELAKSIAENGVITPTIVRQCGDGEYELISGHRRKAACEIAGVTKMPVVVRDLDDDAATVIMVDSNNQRENVLPSEKAFAYKMKLDALKNGGAQLGHLQKSRDVLAKNSDDSREQVRRYIRLTELIPQLLKMVDDKRIAFNPAVEISYLTKEEQADLYETMDCEQCTPSLSQTQKLKKLSGEGKLDESKMMEIMQEQKANQKEQVRISYEKVKAILKKDMPPRDLEDFILKAVADYQKKLLRQQQNRDSR